MSLETLMADLLIEHKRTNELLTQLVHQPSAQLYTLKRAAAILSVSYSTMVERTASGEWPSKSNGKRKLVSLDEIKTVMEEKR